MTLTVHAMGEQGFPSCVTEPEHWPTVVGWSWGSWKPLDVKVLCLPFAPKCLPLLGVNVSLELAHLPRFWDSGFFWVASDMLDTRLQIFLSPNPVVCVCPILPTVWTSSFSLNGRQFKLSFVFKFGKLGFSRQNKGQCTETFPVGQHKVKATLSVSLQGTAHEKSVSPTWPCNCNGSTKFATKLFWSWMARDQNGGICDERHKFSKWYFGHNFREYWCLRRRFGLKNISAGLCDSHVLSSNSRCDSCQSTEISGRCHYSQSVWRPACLLLWNWENPGWILYVFACLNMAENFLASVKNKKRDLSTQSLSCRFVWCHSEIQARSGVVVARNAQGSLRPNFYKTNLSKATFREKQGNKWGRKFRLLKHLITPRNVPSRQKQTHFQKANRWRMECNVWLFGILPFVAQSFQTKLHRPLNSHAEGTHAERRLFLGPPSGPLDWTTSCRVRALLSNVLTPRGGLFADFSTVASWRRHSQALRNSPSHRVCALHGNSALGVSVLRSRSLSTGRLSTYPCTYT